MLKSHLHALPTTKFILLKDSLQEPGGQFLDHLISEHLKKNKTTIHYCSFEGNFRRTRNKFREKGEGIVLHDFTSDCRDWLENNQSTTFENICSLLGSNDVVIIDSISAAVCSREFTNVYGVLNTLRYSNVLQIISILHRDLLETDCNLQYFTHLSTLSINLEPKFNGKSRLRYTYKKLGGKIIRQIEEYGFEKGELLTNKLEKLDPKKLLEKSTKPEINPATLSTFKISLTAQERESKENVPLPYLPKPEKETSGNIFYEFDEVDDWDEEDPDDDLDI